MLLFFCLCPPSIILWRPVVQWAACGLVLRGSGLLSEVHRSESRSGFGVQVSKKKKKKILIFQVVLTKPTVSQGQGYKQGPNFVVLYSEQ